MSFPIPSCALNLVARNPRVERPRNRSPITLLIDDSTPCINPLYYFASQVPKDAVDYHYTKNKGKWYFDSDSKFRHPIVDSIDQEFVHEFARLVNSKEVKGKISVIPYPAGLGRVDRALKGFSPAKVKDYVSTFKREIAPKFDFGPEMLTHTRALNLRTGSLMSGISEHDWSQKQDSVTLTKYIALALKILKSSGLKPTGVTSPCNFGIYVEKDYVKALLSAVKQVLDSKVAWYFLHVDSESQTVDHRVMYLDRENGEAVVSLIGSMRDPFRASQITDLDYETWTREEIDPMLSKDGNSGRIATLVSSVSYVTIMTHWQSLYSNGSREGLKALGELLSRINNHLSDKIVWMRCSEIANYIACSSSASFRTLSDSTDGSTLRIEISSPFPCKDFTFSFELGSRPKEIALNKNNHALILEKVEKNDLLKPNSWLALEEKGRVTILVCLGELSSASSKIVSYGYVKKTQRKVKKQDFYSSVSIKLR